MNTESRRKKKSTAHRARRCFTGKLGDFDLLYRPVSIPRRAMEKIVEVWCEENSYVQRDYQASACLASIFFGLNAEALRQERMQGVAGWMHA